MKTNLMMIALLLAGCTKAPVVVPPSAPPAPEPAPNVTQVFITGNGLKSATPIGSCKRLHSLEVGAGDGVAPSEASRTFPPPLLAAELLLQGDSPLSILRIRCCDSPH